MLKLKVDLGKWILIDKEGHAIQTTWQNFGYDSAVYRFAPAAAAAGESSREFLVCVQDPKRIKIIDILGPQKLESQNSTKLLPAQDTESTPDDQYTPLLQSTETPPNDGSTYSTTVKKLFFVFGCTLAIIIAMYLLYMVTGTALFSYFCGFLLMLAMLYYLYLI